MFALILVHLLFLFIIPGPSRLKDSSEYLQQADNLRSHGSYYSGDLSEAYDPALFSLRPPGYGLFLLIAGKPYASDIFISILQSLLSIGSFMMVSKLIRNLYKDFNPLILLVPLLFFPSQFIYSNMIMSEILFQFLVIMVIYFLVKYLGSGQAKDLIMMQFYSSAALLTKPVFYIFPVLFFLIFLIYSRKFRINPKHLVYFLIPFVVISLVVFNNYSNTGVIEYSGVQRKLMINYNMRYLLTDAVNEEYAYHAIDSVQEAVSGLNYPQQAQRITDASIAWIKEYPVLYLFQHVKGFFKFYLDPGKWDIDMYFYSGPVPDSEHHTKDKLNGLSAVYYGIALIINLILFILMVVFFVSSRINFSIRFSIAVILIGFALFTGPSASSRFRVPVYPVILFAAMAGLYNFPPAKRFISRPD